jgi:hypothetical protein
LKALEFKKRLDIFIIIVLILGVLVWLMKSGF